MRNAITLKMSARQKEIIIGKILGDGHLETRTQGKTYRLKIEHSIHQKEYVNWLYQELQSLTSSEPKGKLQRVKGKEYEKVWFNTRATSSLQFYGNQFYRNGKKVVPKLIHKWLTPLALAVWFMDDGSIKSKECRGRILNTQSFDATSLKRLQEALKRNFRIETTLRKQPEGQQIYIPSPAIPRFQAVIGEFILPSMKYKLG